MGKPVQGKKDTRGKKLSWTYRNKKRQGRPTKSESDENVQIGNKNGRIIVRNLSFKVTEADVKQLYEPFGEIEEINLLRRPDGKPVGCGFVQFKNVADASKAIFNTNKKEFLGRPINSDWAISKDQYYEKVKQGKDHDEKIEDEVKECEQNEKETRDAKNSQPLKKKHNARKAEERKLKILQKRKKRARIVVRNLPFKATEETVREHFSKFGNIEDVRILTKPDGSNIGCAFVQFELVQSAAKAIHHANLKPLLDREIIVDWAIPKNKFGAPSNVKHEEIDITEEKQEEEVNENRVPDVDVKEEIISDEEPTVNDDSNSVDDEKSIKSENGSESEEEEEDGDEEEEDNDVCEGKVKLENAEESKPRIISNDVSEGRTVFLKNVPFQATNEDLKACMEQYGPIFYALVCVDSLTEHSKGTAFVKFKNVEDAEKCLSAGTELKIFDQVLDPHRALHRNEVEDKKSLKSDKIKDSRNLYLVKEGVILASHSAAMGVSQQDIEKRLQLEGWKSQMLRNLNMFVSRNRLVVQNLPKTLNDVQLRQLFKNHAGPNAVITEARVMRNLRKPDAQGVGESKEYGFVAFTKHDDALKALRSINNNPNIFTKHKRPIVAFSIENRVMVNAKLKRMKRQEDSPSKRLKIERSQGSENPDVSYRGFTSKPSRVEGRPTFKFNKQAEQFKHLLQNKKKEMKMAKIQKEKRMRNEISRKEVKPKRGKKKPNPEDVNFAQLVNRYKQNLTTNPNMKSKWYDG